MCHGDPRPADDDALAWRHDMLTCWLPGKIKAAGVRKKVQHRQPAGIQTWNIPRGPKTAVHMAITVAVVVARNATPNKR